MPFNHDPEGTRLPIKLDSTSNGEFEPVPLGPLHKAAIKLAHTNASEAAKKLGLSRRNFLTSAMGSASTLLAFNNAYAKAGLTGGFYDLNKESFLDQEIASAELLNKEFVFDVQGHFVGQNGLGRVGLGDSDKFIKDIFMDSDTDMMVLSFIPSRRNNELLTMNEATATQSIVEKMEGSHRLLLHGRVNPNQPGDLESMDELVERWGISAFKTYTQWGPNGEGFFLHDAQGTRLIERARKTGVKNICIHKGLPFSRKSYNHSLSLDVGIVAKRYPDVNFLIYHSGFITRQKEGPYDPNRKQGVDSLIKSVLDNNIPKGGNVYAELGSTWRYLSRDPDMAAHTIGKLLKYIGEDNILYGSDCIWYGSPQDQIQTFRKFQISKEFQEKYGYPDITDAIRAKIFGLNAARVYGIQMEEITRRASKDKIHKEREAYLENPDPHYLTYGPKTRREFISFRKLHGAP